MVLYKRRKLSPVCYEAHTIGVKSLDFRKHSKAGVVGVYSSAPVHYLNCSFRPGLRPTLMHNQHHFVRFFFSFLVCRAAWACGRP